MKRFLLYSIYCSMFVVLVLGVYLIIDSVSDKGTTLLTNYDYVYDVLNDATETVSKNSWTETLTRPYTVENIKIVKNFYNREATEEEQKNSIISYEDTYMQNYGICYGGKESFEVVAALEGDVTEVLEDELVGNSITIRHSDSSFTIYQSVKDIQVKQGDHVSQGTVIAKSGTSNINKDLYNHLYFELLINNKNVNPEEYYDKVL